MESPEGERLSREEAENAAKIVETVASDVRRGRQMEAVSQHGTIVNAYTKSPEQMEGRLTSEDYRRALETVEAMQREAADETALTAHFFKLMRGLHNTAVGSINVLKELSDLLLIPSAGNQYDYHFREENRSQLRDLLTDAKARLEQLKESAAAKEIVPDTLRDHLPGNG